VALVCIAHNGCGYVECGKGVEKLFSKSHAAEYYDFVFKFFAIKPN